MGTYYKPQSPIQSGEDFIYPITTADQIMKSDNSRRLEQAGLIVADDSTKLGGKAPEYYLQPRNLLDNSDFRNPVNQRGQTSYTGQVYGIDRWYGGRASQKVEIRNTDVTVTATGSSYAGIKQKIANIDRLSGKTVTLATYVYSTVGVAVGFTDGDDNTVSETVDNRSGSRVILCTCTVPSNATPDTFIPRILLRATAQNDYMSCYWAALYEDSYTVDTLPPYVPKGKHVEMLNCGASLTPHNLLDNSDFRNPVNQRGQTSWNGNGHCIDRWSIYSTDESKRAVSIDSNGLTVQGNSAVRQIVPSQITPKDSSEYTFALCKSDGTIVTFSSLWRDSDGNLVCAISGEAATYIWAALYEGSYTADTLPPYVPKGYAAELAACNSAPVSLNGGYGGGSLQAYPVGSIYMSVNSTSPASLFGGTWERIKGRFLIGTEKPENNDDGTSPGNYNYAAGSKSGEATHKLSINEIPSHAGHLYGNAGGVDGKGDAKGAWLKDINVNSSLTTSYGWNYKNNEYYPTNRSLGGNAAHNNMPPYLAVYMWKRVN